MLYFFSVCQNCSSLWISHGHEDRTNGAYGSRSPGRHKLDRSNIVREGRLMDNLNRRGTQYRYCYSSSSNRHHDRHRYHPYKRNYRG